LALRVDYVLRETGANLKRNFSLTFASLITVVVSLTLVGSALLIRTGVENATAQWKGNVEFIVYMNPEATQDQIDAVGRSLGQNPQVRKATFFTQEQAFEEFRQLFKDSEAMIESVSDPSMLPSSWRVAPQSSNAEEIRSLADIYENQPGVMTVELQQEAIKSLFEASNMLQTAVVVAAVVLLVAAGLLILNTIRTAIYARRREIEVMKLVGATNSFIRIPFMLEGLAQGLIGAVAAVGLTRLVNRLVSSRVDEGESLALLQNFYVTAGELRSTSLILLLVGVLVGTVGSGIAVTRFLDV